MPDLIRHPLSVWIPAPAPEIIDPGFAGMTSFGGFIPGCFLNHEPLNPRIKTFRGRL
jgi:hypothetical protein